MIMEFLQDLEKRKVSSRKFSSARDPSSPRDSKICKVGQESGIKCKICK